MGNEQFEGYGLKDTETLEELKKLQEEYGKTENTYKEALLHMQESAKEYQEKMKANNPYAEAIAQARKEQEELTVNVGFYRDAQEKRLSVDKWYKEEFDKLMQNKMQMSDNENSQAMMDLTSLYNDRYAQADAEVWQERGAKIGDIVGDGFEDILTKYDDFGGSMKAMASDIANYLIQESVRALLQQFFAVEQIQGLVGALSKGSKKGGFLGTAKNIVKGIGKHFGLPSFHDGGIVPVGANAELAGTKEQLAVLKGGERILSPGENTNYNNNQQGSSPVVFNNFNVKAWDSKDVSKYLLENKQLLNQITYQGIKDNNSHLRNMVRNA